VMLGQIYGLFTLGGHKKKNFVRVPHTKILKKRRLKDRASAGGVCSLLRIRSTGTRLERIKECSRHNRRNRPKTSWRTELEEDSLYL
jgi:hypothetical protein